MKLYTFSKLRHLLLAVFHVPAAFQRKNATVRREPISVVHEPKVHSIL